MLANARKDHSLPLLLLTVSHIRDDKRWYKSKNDGKKLKESRSATNVSLVLLPDRMRMHFVHHHVEK